VPWRRKQTGWTGRASRRAGSRLWSWGMCASSADEGPRLAKPALVQPQPAFYLDLGQEPLVVADHHKRAFVGVERALQLGGGALLYVPVVAERGEALLGGVTGLDRVQRLNHRGHTEHFGHGPVAGQRQGLWEAPQHPLSVLALLAS
jgi:hypothetical protein